ncbi:MAG: glycosyltransferase [Alphaproteobacteria bacterium]|nr:glycosyltransferase [Alphaproteobacteria bacterium]
MNKTLQSENWSTRKQAMFQHVEASASDRARWINTNLYYHKRDVAYLNFILSKDCSVLDIGCGNGWLLSQLNARVKCGIDLSPSMVDVAKKTCPEATVIQADIEARSDLKKIRDHGPFDYIILSDTLAFLDDIEVGLSHVRQLCGPSTRVVLSRYNQLWEPVLKFGELIGRKQRMKFDLNWISSDDVRSFCALSGLDLLTSESHQIIPFRLLGLGHLMNKWLAPLPLIRALNLRQYVVARPTLDQKRLKPSVSVIVPVRNEAGNIEPAVKRLSKFPGDLELIYVEGNSSDNSWDEIQRVKTAYKDTNIVALKQPGKGKGDAVHYAFQQASGDILMILDGDLTVPPEDMIKFYNVLALGIGEFVNGSRLVYGMEKDAMRFLNYYANRTFARIFSYLLNQQFTDTLCGTKVMFRRDYEKILSNKSFFGDFDPFGDFDFIFGAAKLNLKIIEVPVRYRARTYGSTQISRFRHGFMLLQMVIFAFRKLKAI